MKSLLALLLLATPALADEMWTTPSGQAFWDLDAANASVFAVPTPRGDLRLYIPGLADRIEKRGVHQAYWIGTGDTDCGATLTGPDGVASADWGFGTVTFDAPTFPTGWTATLGRCNALPAFGLRAEPFAPG